MGFDGPLGDLARRMWTLRRKPLEAFLAPVAAVPAQGDAPAALVCADGSLVSLIRIAGSRTAIGREELDRFVALATRRLTTALAAPGHALHVVFERAPDAGPAFAEAAAERARRGCARLGLELGDLIAERAARLGPLTAPELWVAACWTRPAAIDREQAHRDARRLKRRLKGWLPREPESQCPAAADGAIGPRHAAFAAAVLAVLAEAGLAADAPDADASCRLIRILLNGADTTGPDWTPSTAANEGPARATEPPEDGAFPPPLAPQLLIRDPERDGPAVRIGNRTWRPLDMLLGPRAARPFGELLRTLPRDLPLRASLLIEGGGMAGAAAALKRTASAFLAFSSPDSRAVRNAFLELDRLARDSHAVVRLRLGLLTWAGPEEGREVLERRLGRLQQVAEGWGELALTPLVGDPLEAVAASVPGFACGGTAEPALAPLGEALRMMPADRPAPPSGPEAPHLFRSPDGRPLPFGETGDYAVDLIYGIPGRGKSVLSNALALAFLLQDGPASLPRCAVIDVGPSSSGLIDLVRSALPPDRRHEAVHRRWTMDASNAVNPLDTQLGLRRPLPAETAFQHNLLAAMLTPAGAPGVPDGLREAIGPALEAAYALRSDRTPGAEPHPYLPGIEPEADAALAEHAVRLPEGPLWWDAVDLLAEAGAHAAAAAAQRRAVPTLGDLLTTIRDPAVQGLIGGAALPTGEPVTAAFVRTLTALASSWPTMFAPTALDLDDVRLASIDLAQVAPSGSAEADRQTACYYLLARHALTRHWWLAEDDLAAADEPYRSLHADRIRALAEAPKRLCFDEYHRTALAPAVRGQVERDVREARKQRVRLALVSQRLEDFGPGLVELATRYWILGAGGMEAEVAALAGTFGLSVTLREIVRHDLTGPGPDGAPALLIAEAEGRRHELHVVNTVGPVELWALTTAPADTALRRRLYARLPPPAARAALARAFPSGSARERIAAELRALAARGGRDTEEAVLDRLADELARAPGPEGGDPC